MRMPKGWMWMVAGLVSLFSVLMFAPVAQADDGQAYFVLNAAFNKINEDLDKGSTGTFIDSGGTFTITVGNNTYTGTITNCEIVVGGAFKQCQLKVDGYTQSLVIRIAIERPHP